MSQFLKIDLALLCLFDGYAVYGDAVIIGTACALAGVVLAAFCIITEPEVIPADVWEEVD